MKRRNRVEIVMISMALSSMLFVQPTLAAEQNASIAAAGSPSVGAPPVVRDVELAAGGVLHGQVLDTQGVGVGNSPVMIVARGQEIARTTADTNGRFQFIGLRGDTYNVLTVGGESTCRLWAPNTSPPGANQGVALTVSADPVVRAQYGACGPCGQGGFWSFVSNPWISAALITAAIAIPIAASNDSGS